MAQKELAELSQVKDELSDLKIFIADEGNRNSALLDELATAQQEAAAASAGYASKEVSAEANAMALSEASQKLELFEAAEDEAKSRFSTSMMQEEEALTRSEEDARNAKHAQNEA